MFIGHFAPALIAAALPGTGQPAPRLAAMFVAAQLVDYAFFLFVLTEVEHMRETPGLTAMNAGDFYHMPYTHSAIGTLGFAAAWAIGVRLSGGGWRAAWLGAAVVASHWLLDLLVHPPDLTLLGHGPRYGLALWDRPVIAMPLELALWTGAFVFYLSRSRGAWLPPAVLGAAMLALELIDWFMPKATVPVDPVPTATPLAALTAYTLLALLAWWCDRTRRVDVAAAAT